MTHPNPCQVCDAIRTNPSESNTKLALQAGTGESTVRRHRGWLATQDTDEVFGVPRAAITSRGMSYYNPDVGWEKITYNPHKAALLELANYDDLERAIEGYAAAQPPVRAARAITAVVCPADLQLGKTDRNGGTGGTVERTLRATDAFVEYCKVVRPAEIVVAELGDILEGFDNTPSQRAQNDMDLTTQVRTARRLMLEVLAAVRGLAPLVTYAAVTSNHAAVRIAGSKAFASTPGNDWGVEISHQLEDVCAGRVGWEHVRFVRPATEYDEALTYTTASGVRVGMAHSHQAAKQERVADWWQAQAFGRRNGLHEADVLLTGHWHNLSLKQTGDERWIIGAASADPGSSWFTNYSGDSATAGMTAFDLDGASTVPWSNLRIL